METLTESNNGVEPAVDIEELLTAKQIRIPGREYLTYEIELTGISPGILMNRLDPGILSFPEFKSTKRPPKGSVEGLKMGATDVVTEGGDPGRVDPVAAFKTARSVAYFMPGSDGVLGCPTENLKAMLSGAAAAWPKTGLDRTVGACVFFDDYYTPFLDPETKEPLVFDEHAALVTNQYLQRYDAKVCFLVKAASSSRGKKILTSRVFLPKWLLRFHVRYDVSMIPKKAAETIIRNNIWVYAGGYIGQMSWRPSSWKPGPFGRYEVTKYGLVG